MKIATLLALILLTVSAHAAEQSDPYDPFFDGVDNSAQVNQVQNRVDRMERDIMTLQKALYGKSGVGADGGSAATLSATVISLQEQIQALNGRIEVLEHKLAGQASPATNPDANPATTDVAPAADGAQNLAAQLPTVTAPAAAAVSAAPAMTPALAPVAPSASTQDKPAGDPQQAFQTAFDLVKKSDFPKAQIAMQQFITDFKTNPLTSNAYFWLGEISYIEKKYEDAAVQYLRGYKTYPRGAKAPDSLYKLALALGKMKNNKQACKTLNRASTEFPDMNKSLRFKVQEEAKLLSCDASTR